MTIIQTSRQSGGDKSGFGGGGGGSELALDEEDIMLLAESASELAGLKVNARISPPEPKGD